MSKSLIMYLRKSRSDNPAETVEEVLSKHERILQDFCIRQYGSEIPECDIYREVVSGESIRDRVEIKRVLQRIEAGEAESVIVVEPQRLSRGDLIDCGTLIDILQYSHCPVVTPVMTYDLDNKFERRYFQDELLRGRDYLEYTKEILLRGKIAAVKRGCYLQSVPPYGYDRAKIGKDYTLAPNEHADTVRMIFDRFVVRYSTWEICKELDKLGIVTPSGGIGWKTATIDKILKNRHYIGLVTYQRDKSTVVVMEGRKASKRVRQEEGSYIVAEGKHPAIIDRNVFEKAQELLSQRPPVQDVKLRNALAGILYCKRCGRLMIYKDKGATSQYLCCKTPGCSKAVKYSVMLDTVIESLEKSELPDLQARLSNDEGSSASVREKMLKNIEREIQDLKDQEETQYELLETRKYTQEIFDRRNAALRERMSAAISQRDKLLRSMPREIDYQEKICTLSAAISALRDPEIPAIEKNLLLKTIIERIDCTSDPLRSHGIYDFSLHISLKL